MTVAGYAVRGGQQADLRYYLRVLRVVAGAEFKLKYAGSVLGYGWSLLKPLAIFSVLYVVFGRFFKLSLGFEHYPLYLLVGIVLWTFFADGATLAMGSVVAQASLLRRLAFPRILIPLSATLTVVLTFAVNIVAVGAFVAANRLVPGVGWALIPLLLLELFAFTLGVGLLLATLFVAFRDTGQVWELGAQLLFYASPVIYPIQFLPSWAQPIAFANPFVHVMQEVRIRLLTGAESAEIPSASSVYGTPAGHLIPIAVTFAVLVAALLIFRREAPRFAERV